MPPMQPLQMLQLLQRLQLLQLLQLRATATSAATATTVTTAATAKTARVACAVIHPVLSRQEEHEPCSSVSGGVQLDKARVVVDALTDVRSDDGRSDMVTGCAALLCFSQ